jgi:pimeloyl-ACP methyl ester carboxylesterase
VMILHGGPGAAHDYTLAMTSLADDGRAVVHYDQLGCGRSTHLPDADPSFWTVDLFVAELPTSAMSSASVAASTCSASPGAACWRPSSRCGNPPACAG